MGMVCSGTQIKLFVIFIAITINQSSAFVGESYQEIQRQVGRRGDVQDRKHRDKHPPAVYIYYVTQPMDHFDPYSKQNNQTFKQKVYTNVNYWFPVDGPIFLLIGGEAALMNTSVFLGHHVQIADDNNALLVGVEHRFYGESINDDGLGLNSLRYLSSQQALADIAEVHRYLSEQFQITRNNSWICFGGGYAGSLCAWLRLKYPHLVDGAVASSAPVKAQTNFEEFNNVVAKSLKDPTVGGNGECLQQVSQAFIQIDGLLKLNKYEMLEKDFHSCESISHPNDSLAFVSNLAGIIMGIVQFNNENSRMNIYSLCGVMTTTSDPYYNMGQVNQMFMKAAGKTCVDNSYKSLLQELSNTKVNRNARGLGLRAWTWQTCTQFGYYPACNNRSTCPFSLLMTLESYLAICRDIFKISETEVEEFVKFTNDYYGSNQPKGSKTLFVNGNIDPWHSLSVTRNESDSIAIYINGTAHCADMHYYEETTPKSLEDARQIIEDQVDMWVKDSQRIPG